MVCPSESVFTDDAVLNSASFVSHIWLWPNVLSLDAPLVAVLWQALLACNLRVHLNPWELLVLALSIWLLYLSDHVLDALRPARGQREPLRKILFRRHLLPAVILNVILVPVVWALAFLSLDPMTLRYGCILGVLVVLYFGLVHVFPPSLRRFWPREVFVACVFAAGTFMSVWLTGKALISGVIAASVLFALLCWGNCCVIETWEWQKAGSPPETTPGSTAQWISNHLTFFALVSIACTAALSMTSLVSPSFAVSAVLTSIAFCFLDLGRARIPLHALSVATDSAMCTPALYFAVLWLR